MDRLVPVLNQLQHVLGVVGGSAISLPQLVVVGSQSSGKSSVLENIVGRDFLPRGNNMVTRRPLVLQLINTSHTLTASTTPVPANIPGSAIQAAAIAAYNNGTLGNGVESKTPTPTLPNASSTSSNTSTTSPSTTTPTSSTSTSPQFQEWGEFKHTAGRYYDFNAIRSEIIAETDRVTGRAMCVSSQPIFLRIFSPHFVSLTLVDLPGITKVATRDQPADIEQQIRDMVLKFVSNPNSIIVAVSSANEDIANSEALKIAREVDPTNSRTIGVLTKIDLMDHGTDAIPILTNQIIPLKLGYIGVISRSQRDILDNKPINLSLLAEKRFFETSVYSSLPEQTGTAQLVRRLNALLLNHLQKYLPMIRQHVLASLSDAEKELESYGHPLVIDGMGMDVGLGLGMGMDLGLTMDYYTSTTSNSNGTNGSSMTGGNGGGNSTLISNLEANKSKMLGPMLLDLLSKYAAHFNDFLDGRSTFPIADVSTQQLFGGARINYVFHDVFGGHIDSIDPFDNLTDQDIRTAIRNATGPKPSLFLPEASFEMLVKKQIERLRAPALECIELVAEELQRVARQCEAGNSAILARFPNLHESLVNSVQDMLQRRLAPTKLMVQNLINVELAYINTNHPDFVGGSRALTQLSAARKAKAAAAAAANKENQHASNNTNNTNTTSTTNSHGKIDAQSFSSPPLSSTSSSTFPPSLPSSISFTTSTSPSSSTSPASSYTSLSTSSTISSASSSMISPPTSLALDANDEVALALTSKPPTERELMETEVVKLLIGNYFAIAKKTIKDLVPKTIMYLLVNKTKQTIQSELVARLYREDNFPVLLKEADGLAAKRQACLELIATLKKALDILNQIKDTTV